MSYPAYIEAPTTATAGGQPMDPDTLCVYTADGSGGPTDAFVLIAAMQPLFPGQTIQFIEYDDADFPPSYPPDEKRRQWLLIIGGEDYSWAEAWLRAMFDVNGVNGGGIGNPGKFEMLPVPGSPRETIPQWVPTAPPPPPPPPPAPVTLAQGQNWLAAYNAQQVAAGLPTYVLMQMAPGVSVPSAPAPAAPVFP